nr:hypothetical protein BaRGS_005546 [Batillaria attramentaria]KAG5690544.1 hypothetical protein BaRGS_014677 [Batillaria attramentaria]
MPSMTTKDSLMSLVPTEDNRLLLVPREDNRLPLVPTEDNRLLLVPIEDNRVPLVPREDNRLPLVPIKDNLHVAETTPMTFQDGNPPGPGTVTGPDSTPDWWRVIWDSGGENCYCWGEDGKFDLEIISDRR